MHSQAILCVRSRPAEVDNSLGNMTIHLRDAESIQHRMFANKGRNAVCAYDELQSLIAPSIYRRS